MALDVLATMAPDPTKNDVHSEPTARAWGFDLHPPPPGTGRPDGTHAPATLPAAPVPGKLEQLKARVRETARRREEARRAQKASEATRRSKATRMREIAAQYAGKATRPFVGWDFLNGGVGFLQDIAVVASRALGEKMIDSHGKDVEELSVVSYTETTANATDNPYASSSFIGHSLWMCPSGAASDSWSAVISEKASEIGTFCFPPHITLVAGMLTPVGDVLAQTKLLAAKLRPYVFEFDVVQQSSVYFQCVFAKMKETEEVMAANRAARMVFKERSSDPPYLPHLSLIYGDLNPKLKHAHLPQLKTQIRQQVTTTFLVDCIEVWSTQGPVEDWYLVETVPLQG